nr:uncharacterized protein I203_05197 [Kwoniella mangroviensis CBS 8507]OCF65522.1 hypothetical protein I203_05197 [Kwoniella mangroviensis CBS 8507]
MSSAYLQALNYSDNLLSLPQRLIYTLFKQRDIEALIPMAIRAIVVGVLFAVVRRVLNYATARISQNVSAQSQIHDFQLSTIDSKSSIISSHSPGSSGENKSGWGRVGIHIPSWESTEVIGQVLPTYHDEDGQGEGTIEEEVYEAELEPQTAIAAVGGGGGRGKHDLAPSTVTMSGLLNAIDGVSSQENCVSVATTPENCFCIFFPLEDFQDHSSSTSSQADFKDEDEQTTKIKNSEKVQTDNEDIPILIKDQQELENLADKFVKSIFDDFHVQNQQLEIRVSDKMDGYNGDQKTKSTWSESDKSENPKTSISISMASLQSYLLQYKGDPISACDNQNIEKWLEDEKAVKANGIGKSNFESLQGGGKKDEDLKFELENSSTARMKRSHTKTSKSKFKSVQEEKKKKKDDEDERGDINEKVKIDPGQGNDDKEDIVETNDENNSGNGVKSD